MRKKKRVELLPKETAEKDTREVFPVMRGMTREPFTDMALHTAESADKVRDWERNL